MRLGKEAGSMTMAFTGDWGKLARTEVHVAPPLVDCCKSPGTNPAEILGPAGNAPTAAYTVLLSRGSTASPFTHPDTGLIWIQLAPPFAERHTREIDGQDTNATSGKHADPAYSVPREA